MPAQPFGRKPGDPCHLCPPDGPKGHLVARFERSRDGEPPRAGGPPGPAPHLHHLACSVCGVWYESAAHGSMDALLRAQLKDFKNPDVRPEHCPQCGKAVAARSLRDSFSQRSHSLGNPLAKKVVCCTACVLLVWDIPTEMEKLLAELHEQAKTKSTPP